MPRKNTLVAVYDLSVGPDTYNFAPFILLAQAEQQYRGYESLHIVIVPGSIGDGYRPGFGLWQEAHKNWRFRQIIMPLLSAFAPEAQVTICSEREQARPILEAASPKEIYPSSYSLEKPVALFSLKAVHETLTAGRSLPSYRISQQADTYIKAWKAAIVGQRKLITITLRQTHYWSERNSNIDAWVSFAKSLDPQHYYPVFVCDTDQALNPDRELQDFQTMAAASFNIEMRHALYENSTLNMMVNGGPAILCNYSQNAAYLYFKVISKGVVCTNLAYFDKERFLPGRQWFNAKPTQRLIWEDDRLGVITKAFNEMDKRLEGEVLTPLEILSENAKLALASGAIEEAWDWSAVAVSFYDEDPRSWALRVEVLLSTARFLEGCYVLTYGFQINAQLKFLWEQCIESQRGSDLCSLYLQALRFAEAYPDWKAVLFRDIAIFNAVREDELHRVCSGKKIVIFGTGQGASYVCDCFQENWEIICFADNDTKKQGSIFRGLPVYSVSQIRSLNWDLVLIASSFAQEITCQLFSEGFDLSRIIILASSMLEPQPISL